MSQIPSLTIERIYLPLAEALDRLESELGNGKNESEAAQTELANARAALALLKDELPSAQEVLDEFLGGMGLLQAQFDQAQTEASREAAHSPALSERLSNESLRMVTKLFAALAPTPAAAQRAYAQVLGQAALLSRALDEAQKDGWSRGNYVSEAREDLVHQFVGVVADAARGIIAN